MTGPTTLLFQRYEQKLAAAGLVTSGEPVMGFLDARLEWNREAAIIPELERVIQGLSINSILFSRPAEPYRTIIDYLSGQAVDAICPQDCETRTFLHDLPVARSLDAGRIVRLLKKRKGVIIHRDGLITYGMVSLEQAYVTYSSICFACFVKFFADYLACLRRGRINDRFQAVFQAVVERLDPPPFLSGRLQPGPLKTEQAVINAMCEAGRATVENRLVDSYFGNLSCRLNDTLYISQTASSLDELEGLIDPVPLDGSSCAGLTASSELAAHLEIVRKTGCRTILHGHPRFAVILSMDCEKAGCENRGACHIRCREERSVCGIPIVPGEVGAGVHGLCNTVPKAIVDRRGVIVHGHGLFTIGTDDFAVPFENLLTIERDCRRTYFRRVAELS